MSYILHIETSTKVCSVSLGENGKLIASKEEYSEKYIHAERLTLLIKDLIQENKIDFKDLSAIAVNKGPGSYTGLRIGISTAKGLCYALNIPLISIDSLLNLYMNFKANIDFVNENNVVIPMIDARRNEVYTVSYLEDGTQLTKIQAKIIEADFFKPYLNYNKVHLIGDGCHKFKNRFKHSNFNYHTDILCSSISMLSVVYNKFQNNEYENTAYFEPYYLKDFKPS